ncbi:MAG: Ig domain-containing protein [Terriglobales bacterium]
MKRLVSNAWLAAACGLAVLLAAALGCGGGGGGGTTTPPPPPTLVITTTTLNDGVVGQAYTNQSVMASGGTGARTFSIVPGSSLPAGLSIDPMTGAITGTPTGPAGVSNFTVMVVDSATPQQSTMRALAIDINEPLVITTMTLPDAAIGSPYSAAVMATGGEDTPNTRTFTFQGSLPAVITMNADGVFSGAASAGATSSTFTVRVADGSSPQQVDTQPLSINILAATGRNDTIATATTLTNGPFNASISPIIDPANAVLLNPDIDVYRIIANAGATVTITVVGPGLNPSSSLDPVIEIVNTSDVRFPNNCRDPGDNSVSAPIIQDTTPAAFDDQCINNDIDLGITRDSMLEFQVPGAGVVTFFVRVLDFRGDARPDLRYEITINGAN